MKFIRNILSVGALFATVSMANILTNGSFENGAFVANAGDGGMSLPVGSTAITGWTVVSGETAWLPSGAFGLTPQDSNYFLDLTGYHDSVPYGGVTQQ